MNYEITPEVLAVAAQMAAKAGTGEGPEEYITKRIDMLIQVWVDECGRDPVKTAEARAVAAEAELENTKRQLAEREAALSAKSAEIESFKAAAAVTQDEKNQ